MAALFSIALLLCAPAAGVGTDCKLVRFTHPFADGVAQCEEFRDRLSERLAAPYFLGAFTCVLAGPDA